MIQKPQQPVPSPSKNSSPEFNQQWSSEQQDPRHWQTHKREVGANQQVQQPPLQNYSTNSTPWQQHNSDMQQQPNVQQWQQSMEPAQQWIPQNQQDQGNVPEMDGNWQAGRGSNISAVSPMNQVPESSQERRRPVLTPATSSASLNDSSATTNSKMLKDRQDSVFSESSRTSSNFQGQDQDNVDVDWNADTEWDTVASPDLSANFGQMSLNNEPGKVDPQSSRVQQSMPRSKVNGDVTQENNPVQLTDHGNVMENVSLGQDAEGYGLYQNDDEKVAESATYDQWYKGTASENRSRDVENYENVQQRLEFPKWGGEFVNLEVVQPEAQVRDAFGSKESINKETPDNDLVKDVTKASKDYRLEPSNSEVLTLTVQQPQVEQACI